MSTAFHDAMDRSQISEGVDLICGASQKKRMGENPDVRRERAPRKAAQGFDAKRSGRTGRDCHQESAKN
jgi:hypothetical protein